MITEIREFKFKDLIIVQICQRIVDNEEPLKILCLYDNELSNENKHFYCGSSEI